MNKNIPTYQLNILSKQEDDALDVFLLNQKMETPGVSIDIPYRTSYYGVGICLQGKAELKANLKSYNITPNCITAMSPHIIKQWQYMSDDFETLTIFFTKDFITTNNNLILDKFQFFDSVANHSFQLSATQSKNITASLIFLQRKYGTPHVYRNEILKSGINILLYEIASIYDMQIVALNGVQNRSQLLASEFKKLVILHFSRERSVKFYADNLFITPKHLTDILNEVTGKTASEWINEAILLEAKVLLQNPALTIAQIADLLHFTDQFTFSKFFKNLTGLSPVAYKQAL
jgi:AraC-like DNA-binding protein